MAKLVSGMENVDAEQKLGGGEEFERETREEESGLAGARSAHRSRGHLKATIMIARTFHEREAYQGVERQGVIKRVEDREDDARGSLCLFLLLSTGQKGESFICSRSLCIPHTHSRSIKAICTSNAAAKAPLRPRPSVRMQVSLTNEDDWYDSERWEAFGKSNARVSGAETNKKEEKEVEVEAKPQDSRRSGGNEVQWMKLAGCDVCLPKDLRKPIDGVRFAGIVHFIGGVFVGAAPKQAYSTFVEEMVSRARVVVIATPCAGLTGMDHYKAAFEAAYKFAGATKALQGELGSDIFDPSELPTIGMGHSLGCKVQILINSMDDTKKIIGRDRAANVHIAFNNYDAKKSIPILTELSKLQSEMSKGLAAAAPFLESISAFANSMKTNSQLKDVFSSESASKVFSFIEMLSETGKNFAANSREPMEEFRC
eukprot:768695-Hanusia_phi.AAC.12